MIVYLILNQSAFPIQFQLSQDDPLYINCGVTGYNFKKNRVFLSLKIYFVLANSEDPNYFILSSEINEHQKQIKVISTTSEVILYQSLVIDISLCFHCNVFMDCNV